MNKKNIKKILIFSLAYYPNHVGGAEVAIKEITDRISKDKYEFHLICLRFDSNLVRQEKIGNVFIHRIGFTKKNPSMEDLKKFPLHLNKYIFQFSAAFKAIILHRKYKFSGIWAMMAHSCGVPAAIFKILNKNIPYLLTLQEGDPPREIEKMMKPLWPLFKRAFTSATIVHPISNFLEKWARSMGFKGESVLIPNGFTPAYFLEDINKDELDNLKNNLKKGKDDIFLVTVSRLVYKNGIDDCLRALKLLPNNIKFIVVGGGPLDTELKALTKDLGLENRVKFIGQVDRSETAKYRAVSDIFIRPSRSEGMGNSFVSAMVSRLPIITTQEGGIADFLFDAKRNSDKSTTGYAVDIDSPDQIIKAVNEILANPKKAKEVTDNAYKLAIENYDWDKIAVKMELEIFNKMIRK